MKIIFLRQLFIFILFLGSALAGAQDAVSRGDFGSFARSLNQRPYGYEVIKDPTGGAPTSQVERFVVKSGDCGFSQTWNDCKSDRERSELSEKNRTNKDAKVYWYGWSIYFPKDYPTIFPVKVALGQFHQDKGSPLWMFQQLQTGYVLEPVFLENEKSYLLIDESNLRERWHRIEVEVLWSNNSKGFFRVWVNGEQKVNYNGPTKESELVYFKYGLYRSFLSRYKKAAEVPAQQIYFSNVKRSTTRKGLGVNHE